MGTIVVAQIGKTKYTETTYKRKPEEAGVESKYAFEAVLQEALADNPKKVDLIILGTKDSYFGTLYEYYKLSTNDKCQLDPKWIEEDWNKRGDEMDLTGKFVQGIGDLSTTGSLIRSQYAADLSAKLTSSFPANSHIAVTVAIIDQGQAGEELPSNFEVIRKAVERVMQGEKSDDNWDIYFDITNGFRSFPIYIYTLTNYLSRIGQNKTACHIFYGMFDVARTLGYTPLVNLQVVDELLELINAVNEFQNCGSVKQILGILEKHPEWDIPIGINEKETLSYAFKMFDYGTNSNNLAAIERGINLLTNVEKPMDDAEKLLLTSISEDFKKRFGTEESRSKKPYPYSFLLIQLADWFHKMGREGNAAIAVQEALPTYLMERYPDQSKKFLLILRIANPKSKYDRECDFRKEHYLFDFDLRQPIKNNLKYLQRAEEDIGEDIYGNYQEIKQNVRDVMAHIALTEEKKDEDDYEKYKKTIEKQIEFLSKEIDDAEDAAQSHGENDLSVGDTLVNCLFYGLMTEDENKNVDKLLMGQKNQLAAIFEDPNLGHDEFMSKWDEWELLEEYNLLKKYMCKWAPPDPQNSDEDLAQYFYEKCNKHRNGKAGYEKLMNYIDNCHNISSLL